MTDAIKAEDILHQAAQGNFTDVGNWLSQIEHMPKGREKLEAANAADEHGWTLLHWIAEHEPAGKLQEVQIVDFTSRLLAAGANPHQGNEEGRTPFNIAAGASPIIGRRMTQHWFGQAQRGEEPAPTKYGTTLKRPIGEEDQPPGFNDTTGKFGSSLTQYMAKWSGDFEIEEQLKAAVDNILETSRRMKIAIASEDGWTPLHAATVMGRYNAVESLARRYTFRELTMETKSPYTGHYGPKDSDIVVYPENQDARALAQTRIDHIDALPDSKRTRPDMVEMRANLVRCQTVIETAIQKAAGAPQQDPGPAQGR